MSTAQRCDHWSRSRLSPSTTTSQLDPGWTYLLSYVPQFVLCSYSRKKDIIMCGISVSSYGHQISAIIPALASLLCYFVFSHRVTVVFQRFHCFLHAQLSCVLSLPCWARGEEQAGFSYLLIPHSQHTEDYQTLDGFSPLKKHTAMAGWGYGMEKMIGIDCYCY